MTTTESVETKPRMMHWTCRKCKCKWSEPIVQNYKAGQNGRHTEDAYETSICDACLNRMGPNWKTT